uniref:Protein phosphatase 4 regulatory subunit 2 n=1 Tax=Sander lucioperca TaxID=283035 RepID=A0A8D0AUT1_SANLU
MDIDALLEAFQDFEKKGKKETCPELEQFLCHVAKTGQPIIPFTIQRLCELLTDPKRNYTGTEKFLMGLEKVIVFVPFYFFRRKNGASSVNRMNGVMFPGNSSLYSDRWEPHTCQLLTSTNQNLPHTPPKWKIELV